MKHIFISASLCIISPIISAATPINGWYSGVFGGYTYLPSNMHKTRQSTTYTDLNYQTGYDAGANLGFKSNPMRYEGEVTYLNANIKNFKENGITQTDVGSYQNAILGLANIYYDIPGLITCLEPFLGVGLGYGWMNLKLNNFSPTSTTDFRITNSAFAYQGTAGLTYNFSENYALNMGYRYIATSSLFDYGHAFAAHIGNLGAVYRFDEARYK